MNDHELKSRLDAELSSITWSVRNSNVVRQQVNQGGVMMKKKISFATIVVIAILLLMATALAVSVSGILWVDWNGNEVDTSDKAYKVVQNTPEPSSEPKEESKPEQEELMTSEELSEKVSSLHMDWANNSEEDYILTSYYDYMGSCGFDCTVRAFISYDEKEFYAILNTAYEMPIPVNIPEGYFFAGGVIEFVFKPKTEFTVISRETSPEGIIITKYDTAEENKIICGYEAAYMPDEYEDTEQLLNSIITVHVDARELNDPANSAMPLPPGETARAVEVKGMDNALAIHSEHGVSIRMRKQMSESLEYKTIDWWNPEDGLLIGTHSFGEYFIQVGSVSVPKEVLMGIISD